MLFSSLEFLFFFLPLSLLLYYACPLRFRNAVLLTVSLIFYGVGEPVYLFLMMGTVVADYCFGLAIERKPKRARALLWSAVLFNLGLLGFFKYYPLLSSLVPFLPTLSVSMPVGISFYTFQALSYVIDVYRHTVRAQQNLIAFGTYVSLFPQLVAGPIVRYCDVDASLSHREHTVRGAAAGVRLFCVGLAKKVLLANPAGQMWESLRIANGEEGTVLGAWLGLCFFAFQIYFDFSGYSDMAVGLGRLFGFEFPVNFRYPYVSKSITDFWRRWHITLSSWFREYVYIPLGGNRVGKARMYRNLLITWSLTGLWHGASWNFVVWGLYFFLLLAIEKAFLSKLLARLPDFVGHLYTLFFIGIGWLIFVFDGSAGMDAVTGLRYAGNLLGIGVSGFGNGYMIYELRRNLIFLLLMAMGSTPLVATVAERWKKRTPRLFGAVSTAAVVFSLTVCTAYLVSSGYNPFLYFRF